MLEPDARELLLDALRPPDDHELVHAVGTSYSLDLHALMFAPLTFALFDWALGDDGRPNPIALLEALRRYADRITMFCQAGQIGVPTGYQPLLTYLEPCVVGVTPRNPEYIFHPKFWVLRFAPTYGGGDRYRLLCLTRNLTFDTSWDTITVVEGERRAGAQTVAQNRPLVAFLEHLIELSPTLADRRRSAIVDLAEDIADVRFDAPEGFGSVRFHPLGIGRNDWPFRRDLRRLLVVSPFLTAGTLTRLLGTGGDNVLISRQEMLDDLGRDAIAGWTTTFALNEGAVQPDASPLADPEPDLRAPGDRPRTGEATGDAIDADLHGLHAKLFVAEHDRDVRFYTGSANATDAAFGGNVEFLVEMRTGRDGVGIDALLETGSGVTTFRDLLVEHEPAGEGPRAPTDAETVVRSLDRARRSIGALDLEARLTPDGEDTYLLELHGSGRLQLPDQVTTFHCWPITRNQGHQVSPRYDTSGLHARFGHIAVAGITSFFAFEVQASSGSVSDAVRFVVNATLIGAPEGRTEQVLLHILRTRDDLLRFLLFLLADTSGGYADLLDQLGAVGASTGQRPEALFEVPPLLETLVRAISRDPGRLDHIAGLLSDLRDTGRAEELLPEGFEELWEPIWTIRQERAG